MILGAGGVAKAIGLALVRAGAVVTVANRSERRGKALADLLKCQSIGWENRGTPFTDILVNCTPWACSLTPRKPPSVRTGSATA